MSQVPHKANGGPKDHYKDLGVIGAPESTNLTAPSGSTHPQLKARPGNQTAPGSRTSGSRSGPEYASFEPLNTAPAGGNSRLHSVLLPADAYSSNKSQPSPPDAPTSEGSDGYKSSTITQQSAYVDFGGAPKKGSTPPAPAKGHGKATADPYHSFSPIPNPVTKPKQEQAASSHYKEVPNLTPADSAPKPYHHIPVNKNVAVNPNLAAPTQQLPMVTAQGISKNAQQGMFGAGVPTLGAEAAAALLKEKPSKKDKKDKK